MYSDEIKDLTQRLFISRGIRTIEKSKIYVDIDGIKSTLEPELREHFNRLTEHLHVTHIDERAEQIMLEVDRWLRGSGVALTLILRANEGYEIFRTFFFTVRDAFVSSSEHGLDGYLSVGIRHGTLSGQLRSALEKNMLITQRNEHDQYEKSEYWADTLESQLGWAVDGIASFLTALSDFSREIDSAIDRMKNTDLQVSTEVKPGQGLFDFSLTPMDLRMLFRKLSQQSTYEQTLDLVLEKLWEMTDTALIRVRG